VTYEDAVSSVTLSTLSWPSSGVTYEDAVRSVTLSTLSWPSSGVTYEDPLSSVNVQNCYGLKGQGSIRVRIKTLFFLHSLHTLYGYIESSVEWPMESLPLEQDDRSVKLYSHIYLLPMVRILCVTALPHTCTWRDVFVTKKSGHVYPFHENNSISCSPFTGSPNGLRKNGLQTAILAGRDSSCHYRFLKKNGRLFVSSCE
jgi:hypothetical protein